MRIITYFINYNDSFYLPFLKEHYGAFSEKIIMYDNYSTDASRIIAADLGMEVRVFGQRGQLNDQHYLDVKNHCWKEQRNKGIDYVIVCDADEFVCIDDLKGSAPKVTGYNMVSDSVPFKSVLEINTGEFSESYSKQAIFSPDEIQEINFVHGCHKNHIKGNITTEGNCRLLHYRMIGGVKVLLERHAEYRKRMSRFNLQHNMGHHYLHADEAKIAEWNFLKSNSKQLW